MDISSSYLIWPEWHWIKSYLIIFTVITAEGSLKMNLIGHVSKFRWLWRQVVAPVWQGPSLEFFQMVPANVIHLVAFWWNNEARNIFWCFQTLTATLHCIKHFIQNCIKCTTHKKKTKTRRPKRFSMYEKHKTFILIFKNSKSDWNEKNAVW